MVATETTETTQYYGHCRHARVYLLTLQIATYLQFCLCATNVKLAHHFIQPH